MWDQASAPGLGQYLLDNGLNRGYGAPALGGQSPFGGGQTPNYPQPMPNAGIGGVMPTLPPQANPMAGGAMTQGQRPAAPTLPSQASPQAQAALSRAFTR